MPHRVYGKVRLTDWEESFNRITDLSMTRHNISSIDASLIHEIEKDPRGDDLHKAYHLHLDYNENGKFRFDNNHTITEVTFVDGENQLDFGVSTPEIFPQILNQVGLRLSHIISTYKVPVTISITQDKYHISTVGEGFAVNSREGIANEGKDIEWLLRNRFVKTPVTKEVIAELRDPKYTSQIGILSTYSYFAELSKSS